MPRFNKNSACCFSHIKKMKHSKLFMDISPATTLERTASKRKGREDDGFLTMPAVNANNARAASPFHTYNSRTSMSSPPQGGPIATHPFPLSFGTQLRNLSKKSFLNDTVSLALSGLSSSRFKRSKNSEFVHMKM